MGISRKHRGRGVIILALLVVSLVALLALVGCSSGTTTTTAAPTGGTDTTAAPSSDTTSGQPANTEISVGMSGEPVSMDALMKEDGNMRMVTNQIYEPLVDIDGPSMKLIPGLAASWTQKDDTTWEFKLQPGVTWSNGDPFTADDVVASVTKEVDPAQKSEIASTYFASIKSATKVDDTTVDIITSGATPTVPNMMSFLPIMNAKYLSSHTPEQIAAGEDGSVGTGPYVLPAGGWQKGSAITLEANPTYWGPKPPVTKITYKFLSEDQTRLSSLMTGETDLMVNLLPEFEPQITEKGLHAESVSSIEFPMIRLKSIGGPMAKKEMRLAANYAIDKESIIKNLYGGYADPAAQALKDGFGGFNPTLTPYPYDLQKAKDLLKQAGYKGEVIQLYGETERWLKAGEVTTAVADMLKAAGFNIELKIVGWNEWLDFILHRDKAPDMIFVSAGDELLDAQKVMDSFLSTKGALSAYGTPELDTKIEAANTAPKIEDRVALQQAVIKEAYDDPYAAVICNSKDVFGESARVMYTPRGDMKLYIKQVTFK